MRGHLIALKHLDCFDFLQNLDLFQNLDRFQNIDCVPYMEKIRGNTPEFCFLTRPSIIISALPNLNKDKEPEITSIKPLNTNVLSFESFDKEIELVIYEKIGMGDGTQANNPWLQEFPDPISRACWDNYLTISASIAGDFILNDESVFYIESIWVVLSIILIKWWS